MVVLVVLLLLALAFGIGAVIEGLLWALLICVAFVVATAWFGWRYLRSIGGRGRQRA